jgi:hypothetical protein
MKKLLYQWRRLGVVFKYAWTLWRTSKMPLVIDTLSPDEEAAIARQADLDGIPVAHWARNHLMKALDPSVQQQLLAGPQVDRTLAAMDAMADVSDAAMEADAGNGAGQGGYVFGMAPELLAEGTSIVPPEPPAAPVVAQRAPNPTINGRRANNGPLRESGPALTGDANPNAKNHPCRFLLPQYPGNFNAGDCQGTCGSKQKEGSPCTWPPNASRNCYAFGAKAGAAPSTFPRA